MLPQFLILFLLSISTHLFVSASEPSSIYDVLQSNGLPMGLLPNGVKDFSLDEAGRFVVYLDQECNAKFGNELHYDRNVSGTLSYGQIAGLSGISAQDLFLWFPVKEIRVDVPSSGLIYFDVGVVYKQFSLFLFESPRDCMALLHPDLQGGSFMGQTVPKVQENSLATLGLFAFLGRETRLFLLRMGIKDLDEQIKDFLSYLECGSLFIYPEFSSLSEYQLFMEVVTDEIGWLDFYSSFPSIFNQERRRSKQRAIQAEKEIILNTVFTVCYDVFSGFAYFTSSTQQPLDANLLAFLLQSQSLLSICLEDYWAAYDRSGELPKFAERGASDSSPSSQMKGRANSSVILEANPKPIDLMKSGDHQHGSRLSYRPSWVGPITVAEMGYVAESEPLHKSLLRKSTYKLISASADMWMGSHLLFIDILDTMGLLMKKLRGNKVTKRERRKIERTLADIASLIPITILMLLPCWTNEKVEYEMDMVESAVKSLGHLGR